MSAIAHGLLAALLIVVIACISAFFAKQSRRVYVWTNLGKQTWSSRIPKFIFQTARVEQPEYVRAKIMQRCPGWTYKHFLDKDCLQYFHEHPIVGLEKVSSLFEQVPSPHKADLFRYYVLYFQGGVFLDSDAMLEENIDEIIEHYDLVLVKAAKKGEGIFNGFIAATPRHIVLQDALKHAASTEQHSFRGNYMQFCRKLESIFRNRNPVRSRLLHETESEGVGSSWLKDSCVIKHYHITKKIPQ